MKKFLERIEDGEVLVGDGAMGTMLMERGLKPGDPPESFNLTHPEIVQEIASLYLDAGADIIQTNTFGGSPLKLSFYGFEGKTEEINRNGVRAVRVAINDRAYISGSCGPSGKFLKPYGDIEPDEMYRNFERQVRALIDASVDIICIETMTDLHEITLAIEATKTISPDTPVMATMTFDATPRGFYTIMGVSIKDASRGLERAGANIIGSNCGNGIENMIKIAKEFKQYTDLPIVIQSNAGIPEIHGTTTIYPETPDFTAKKARDLLSIGVSIIGGCCGTTPEHIKALRAMVDASHT
ncbi:MAG: homocysteine S-methyltransferase family protein [candidate division WOR-3 bacterium]|nr:MAG: homocysteine S-methyltransferase family protein [candidate division WOR-3 bacterium]